MEAASICGSSKRARAPGNMMSQVVTHCLVDGCNADLSLCRDYHRRHKVCETHSKTPKVTIAGREQRFCQQCSRFHSLVEFDEGKRSCRKRLDGHNRRRRKPQSDPLVSRNNNVFSAQQASAPLISFSSSPRMLPPVVGNNDMLVYQKQLNDSSFPEHSYSGAGVASQLHLLQNSLVDQVVDSDRALSLLSSEATPREFGLSHMSTSHGNMMHYCGLGQNNNPTSPPLLSGAGSHRNDVFTPHFPEMLQHGSPTAGSHQTLTFMWE